MMMMMMLMMMMMMMMMMPCGARPLANYSALHHKARLWATQNYRAIYVVVQRPWYCIACRAFTPLLSQCSNE
eukprot:306504-Amphidinium_carterae.1